MKTNLSLVKYLAVLLFFLTYLVINPTVQAQVFINEIQSSNSRTITDDDGDFSDWIELYNAGNATVNLSGFGLSDNVSNPYKWIIPEGVELQEKSYLLIFASGKNRRIAPTEMRNGVIREMYENISGASVNDLINSSKFPDQPDSKSIISDFFDAPINVAENYGQRMYAWFRPNATGFYKFAIAGDDNSQLFISTNESPENVVKIAEVPDWTEYQQFTKYESQTSSSRFLVSGNSYYMQALMKEGQWGDHLTVRLINPNGTVETPMKTTYLFVPGEYMHTSYNISASGEPILLTDKAGNKIDSFGAIAILTDHSYGRKTDGSQERAFFTHPTPGTANDSQSAYTQILKEPEFSIKGGFYSQNIELVLTNSNPDTKLIYTLDGSEPDTNSIGGKTYTYRNQYRKKPGSSQGPNLQNSMQTFLYSNPIMISNRSSATNKLSEITTDYSDNPEYFPKTSLTKATVVRAKVVKSGEVSSRTITHTFFVLPESRSKYSLPVFSISANENQVFDYNVGIHVAGVDFENWRTRNPNSEANGGVDFNWTRDAEIPVNIEFFDVNQSQANLNQQAGIKIHGNWSREHRLKTLRFYARNLYGQDSFNYPLFSDEPYSSYRRFLLRNTGNDFTNAYMRDPLVHTLSKGLEFDRMAYRPSEVFLNGEFWGLMNIRERIDDNYLYQKFGVLETEIDMVQNNQEPELGDMSFFNEMLQLLENNPVSSTQNFQKIQEMMDTESFIDYQIANLFVGNTDWPGNNYRIWRKKIAFNPDAQKGLDGRWRWMMFDTDFAFNIYYGADVNFNMFQFATATNGPGWPNPPHSTFLFRTLLTNTSFKNDFINRYNDLLNTSFSVARTSTVIDSIVGIIQPEMDKHIQRWSSPGTIQDWNWEVDRIRNFTNARTSIVRDQLQQFFNFPGYFNLKVKNPNIDAGTVFVNRLEIKNQEWDGMYAQQIPIKVKAQAEQGFRFVGWSGSIVSDLEEITVQSSLLVTLTANFEETQQVADSVLASFDFNNLSSTTLTEIFSGNTKITFPGTGAGYLDRVTDGTELNALQGITGGYALRVRNPSDTRKLVVAIPTQNFEDIKLSYAIKRTSNGAMQQQLVYRENENQEWKKKGSPINITEEYELVNVSFMDILESKNNPDFEIGIEFLGENAIGSSGNNRFDNLIVRGKLIEQTSIDLATNESPIQFKLGNAYPNPFNPTAVIPYQLSESGNVTLTVFDVMGRQVSVLTDEVQNTGKYEAIFRAEKLSSGVYIARLVQNGKVNVQKLILLK